MIQHPEVAVTCLGLLSTILLVLFLFPPPPRPRVRRRLSGCRHYRIAPVELSDGERVAYLCLDCDLALAPDFASPGKKEHW